jgi:RNA polymerase subunit RPABC4/transcription elongation factor Spt4
VDGFDVALLSQLLLIGTLVAGVVIASLTLGMVIWTYRDIRARSRDTVAHFAAALMVAVLNVFGLVIYLLLRPRETLAEAYERSLEEEALLQNIEEKPICPGCGRPAEARWQVCPYCHTRLKKPCLQCAELLELSWNLCPFCATLQSAPEPARTGRPRRAAPAEAALEFVDGDDA